MIKKGNKTKNKGFTPTPKSFGVSLQGKRGFTLIELLVVIAIIGILSSVVLASLNSARQKSRDAKRISDIKQLQLALEFSYDANGQYPDAINDASLVTPGYIATIPTDNGTAYKYDNITNINADCVVADGGCTKYHIATNLEDLNHPVKGSDIDLVTTTIDGLDGTACDGVAIDRLCYDLTP